MSIASRIEAIEEHIGDIYNSLELGGSDLTNVNKNIVNIDTELIKRYKDYLANGTDAIWNNWDKTSLVGVNQATINNTIKAKMLVAPKGDTKQAILPSEYQQVEYIESTGTQYIDTNFLTQSDFELKIKFAPQDIVTIQDMGFTASTPNWWSIKNNRLESFGNQKVCDLILNKIYNLNVKYSSTSPKSYISMKDENDNLLGELTYVAGVTTNIKISLWASSANLTKTKGIIKIYSCKIIDSLNNLVRNMIPCYRKSDNEIGLYDLINNVFYTNAGTGTFIKGSDAPTPNVSIPIENVKGKNVFDKSNAIDGEYYESNGSVISDSDYCRNDNYVYCAGKTKLTMSGVGENAGNARLIYYDKDKNVVDYWFVRDRTIDVPDTVVYIRISVLKQYKDTLQVEFNSEATLYVPGNSVQIKVQNENYFDYNNYTYDKTILSSYRYIEIKDLKPNTKYTIYNYQITDTTTYPNVYLAYNPNYASMIWTNLINVSYLTVTTNDEGKMYLGAFCSTSWTRAKWNTFIDYFKNAMFVEGIDRTSLYIPHQEQIVNLTLPEGMEFCKIGNYQDKIFKAINGNTVYDSLTSEQKSELIQSNWYKYGAIRKYSITSVNRVGTASTGINYAEVQSFESALPNGFIYCSKYIGNSDATKNNAIRLANTVLYVYDNTFTTLEIAQTALIGLEFYCPRVTPTLTQITDTTLINQLNALEEVYSYNEQTNISQDGDLPFKLDITALVELS